MDQWADTTFSVHCSIGLECTLVLQDTDGSWVGGVRGGLSTEKKRILVQHESSVDPRVVHGGRRCSGNKYYDTEGKFSKGNYKSDLLYRVQYNVCWSSDNMYGQLYIYMYFNCASSHKSTKSLLSSTFVILSWILFFCSFVTHYTSFLMDLFSYLFIY